MESVERNGSSSRKSSMHQNCGKKSHNTGIGSSKGKTYVWKLTAKRSSISKRKKSPEKLNGRRYSLRSSFNSVRVLRSMSNKNKITSVVSTAEAVNLTTAGRKKKKRIKRVVKDEYSRIRKHVRYLLHRMNYEQSLIDAYSTEGWKGQSLEKIRPEKELERAKSEIVRCKLRIRGQFQHLESLISEGRPEDSLFDSEGEIDSEDIVCAKCGLKHLTANNDIILCDGICNRGFHQKCLTPPLLNEDIPPGDEGWLCPGCDCKVDCIDFINEIQGTDLSIEDPWEKVFPEAAAAAGNKQYDDLGSDDPEDDDYAPDVPEIPQTDEGSSSEESFTSEDPMVPNRGVSTENFGYSSDDSEDDDFDPNEPDIKDNPQMDGSCSDESDFTSDTDDLANELSGSKEVSASPTESHLNSCAQSSGKGRSLRGRKSSENVGLQENVALVSSKRERENLDYKKLYDDTCGKASLDSGDDEDWISEGLGKKVKIDAMKRCSLVSPYEKIYTIKNQRNLRSMKSKSTDLVENPEINPEHSSEGTSKSVKRRSCGKLPIDSVNHCVDEQGGTTPKHNSSENRSRKKLQEAFNENQYPGREMKESLADELSITYKQVDKWFGNARHGFRVSANEGSQAVRSSGNRSIIEQLSTPVRSHVTKSSKATSDRTENIKPSKSSPISIKSINHDEKVDAERNSSADQQKPRDEAASDNIAPRIEKETAETVIDSTDRHRLILRELRKGRRCR